MRPLPYVAFVCATTALAAYGAWEIAPGLAPAVLVGVLFGFFWIHDRAGRDRELLSRATLEERTRLMTRLHKPPQD